MTTIVSGFIMVNTLRDRDFYIKMSIPLLKLKYPKIIFLEKESMDLVKHYENEYTQFIPFKKDELFLSDKTEQINNAILPIHRNPTKDTKEYMMIQLQKTDWLKRAIEMNPYQTENFLWIDFGIYHIIDDELVFQKYMKTIMKKTYETIRIPGCSNPSHTSVVFDKTDWTFCGGIVGGKKENLLDFHKYVCETIFYLLTQRIFCWEVNVWHLVQKNHPELFSWYYANHNLSMLSNY